MKGIQAVSAMAGSYRNLGMAGSYRRVLVMAGSYRSPGNEGNSNSLGHGRKLQKSWNGRKLQ